jgi:hypothetical protein
METELSSFFFFALGFGPLEKVVFHLYIEITLVWERGQTQQAKVFLEMGVWAVCIGLVV